MRVYAQITGRSSDPPSLRGDPTSSVPESGAGFTYDPNQIVRTQYGVSAKRPGPSLMDKPHLLSATAPS